VVKVYVSVFGDERGKEIALAGLKSKAKYVRSELGKRMKLRLTPEIRFIEDESLERGSRVIAILDKIKAEKKTLADEDYEEEAESSVSAQDDTDWESDDPDEDIIYVNESAGAGVWSRRRRHRFALFGELGDGVSDQMKQSAVALDTLLDS
ncbi:hypothetical protein Gohar_015958, partial [Gossypium harknessii]|nr:hypothetical protein [Gossypium harknessii]